jgi:hypothetical protein
MESLAATALRGPKMTQRRRRRRRRRRRLRRVFHRLGGTRGGHSVQNRAGGKERGWAPVEVEGSSE